MSILLTSSYFNGVQKGRSLLGHSLFSTRLLMIVFLVCVKHCLQECVCVVLTVALILFFPSLSSLTLLFSLFSHFHLFDPHFTSIICIFFLSFFLIVLFILSCLLILLCSSICSFFPVLSFLLFVLFFLSFIVFFLGLLITFILTFFWWVFVCSFLLFLYLFCLPHSVFPFSLSLSLLSLSLSHSVLCLVSVWLGCSSVAESLCALRCLQSLPSSRAHNQVLLSSSLLSPLCSSPLLLSVCLSISRTGCVSVCLARCELNV